MSLQKRRKNSKVVIRTKEELLCSKCRLVVLISSSDVEELICGDCFAKQIFINELREKPLNKSNIKSNGKYPRGWHLRKLFKGDDGKIFSFGKEITEDQNDNNIERIDT